MDSNTPLKVNLGPLVEGRHSLRTKAALLGSLQLLYSRTAAVWYWIDVDQYRNRGFVLLHHEWIWM